ncbi:ATP-binding protein [Pseudoalteromonas sp. YIC-656]|uniref:ATP-binding protein n=1 Tax=Pseudoalteromonas pernae TaxID=3118054 RepID=UPI003241F051
MKKLYVSLLCTALLSVVLLSWLIDSFATDSYEQDDFSQQRDVLGGMVSYLENVSIEEQQKTLSELNKHFNLDMKFAANSTLALPSPLRQQLFQPSGLVLADEEGLYLVRSSERLNDHHLAMRLPKPEQPKQDLLLTVLFYTGVSLCMWLPLVPLTQRISVLASAAAKFASGKLSTRVAPSRFSYTKQLEQSFNSMAEQINALLEENKLMASSLSHDIRTPIACLRFGLDAALDSDDPSAQQRYLSRMEKDLDTMESMLSSYLNFAALQQQSAELNFSSVELKSYLEEIVEQLSSQFNSLSVTVDCPPEQIINADLHWLARAIQNIIGNALRYAQSRIAIEVQVGNQFLDINIADDGPGIAQQEQHAVLKPFYQSAKHRNQQGYGLGLAICNKVLMWHKGELLVSNSAELNGAKFTLRLPL